jgi:hypothetical protein
MLSVVLLSVVMQSVVMLSVVMQSVVMLSVVMLNVVAPENDVTQLILSNDFKMNISSEFGKEREEKGERGKRKNKGIEK